MSQVKRSRVGDREVTFDVPSDPIVAARAETFEDPFNQYSLPEAILRFRQGFWTFDPHSNDRGVVVVLDRRVLSKRLRRLFIDSLPNCTTQVGPLAQLSGQRHNGSTVRYP